MLEFLLPSTKSLLKCFEASFCPLCCALSAEERRLLTRLKLTAEDIEVLCGSHLKLALTSIRSQTTILQSVVKAIDAVRHKPDGECMVCSHLYTVEERFIQVIRQLDSKIRFRKALEDASLFCRPHLRQTMASGDVPNFVEVQIEKVTAMRDEIAQAALRNSKELHQLLLRANDWVTKLL